ncbi:MAG TPA: helical backbone metal receptor [Candidatus Solibacter sp.]|nr:helical backbone metal receptor [Candidatus Solibacter sp.]
MRRTFIAWLLAAGILLAQPRRIVSTSPSITETLFALGLGDRVIGVSTYCRYPPAVLALPKIGTFIKPDPEKIAVLRPDLVIVQKAKSPQPLPNRLAALGIKYAEVEPGSLAEVYTMIGDIGRATASQGQAEALVAKIRGHLDAIRAEARGAGAPPAVLLIVGRDPGLLSNLVGAGPGAYLDELIGIAGGKNVLADSKVEYPRISMETVVRTDPEVILDAGAMGTTQNDGTKGENELRQPWLAHRELRAVRNRMVFGLTSETLVVPGPRVVDAVEIIARPIREARRRR